MLAHNGPVGTVALQADLTGQGKQAFVAVGHNSHYVPGKPALKQFQERTDFPGAAILHSIPFFPGKRLDGNLHFVKFGAVADICAASRQAILVIAERLEVIAPSLPPKRSQNLSSLDLHWMDIESFLPELFCLLQGTRKYWFWG